MKSTTLILLQLLMVQTVLAQLAISPGTQFSIAGNMQLTLQNTDLINNGIFNAGNSIVRFTGNASSTISGIQSIQFSELEMNKTNNSSILLQRSINVSRSIHFSSGFLDLNGFNADLGSTGQLDGEQENTRITAQNGGEVLFRVSLNSPINANPANLGVFISSEQDLGSVTIKRGHQSQVNGSGLGNSVLRYYDIIPFNNNNLNATLRFRYFDGELNGLDENSLALFESQNTVNWNNLGFTSRDVLTNFVEKTNISSLGRFTLSTANNSLPVHFVLFTVNCEGKKLSISWKTAQEQNSSHFNIENSNDGIHWTVIGTVPAAGNSSIERNYSFTDNNPVLNNNYRIAQYDIDGRVNFTKTLRSSCNATEVFSHWPNPVHDMIYISIVNGKESQAIIKIYDSKGALVKIQKATLLQGNNQLIVNIGSLTNGVYSLSVEWDSGQMKKAVQVLKQ